MRRRRARGRRCRRAGPGRPQPCPAADSASAAVGRVRLVLRDLLESPVGLGVNPAHEERRHRGDPRGVASAGHELLEARQVGLDDLAVALEREDQGHVDAAALGDHGGDRRQPFLGGWDLHEQIRLVDAAVQVTSGRDRAVGVVGESAARPRSTRSRRRRRSRRTPPLSTPRASFDVGDHEVPVRLLDGRAAAQGRRELLVVVGAAGDRLRHDRGVRREAAYALSDELGEMARGQVRPLQVVEPGALTSDLEKLVAVLSCPSPYLGSQVPSRTRARSATWSAVKPNFSMFTAPGADAP